MVEENDSAAGGLEDQDKRISQMGTEPMFKLVMRYSLPSIAGLLVTAIYTLADGVFIGWGVGDAGVAATAVVLPFTTVVMALYTLIGNGGNIVASISLGRGDHLKAEKSLGNTIFLIIIFWVVLVAIVTPTANQIAILCGATDESLDFARQYMQIITFGFVCGGLSGGIGNYMRTAGAPTMNMWFMITAGVLNIFLDWIFVLQLGFGVPGAAWATVISQATAAVMTLIFFTRKTTSIRFYVKYMKLEKSMVKDIFRLGLPGFFMNAIMAITSVMVNQQLLKYGDMTSLTGTNALAGYGAAGRVMQIFFQISIGVSMAAQPIIGYNYGAGYLKRVKSCYWVSSNSAFVGVLITTIIAELIPSQMISLFGLSADTAAYGVWLLRVLMSLLPLSAYGMMGSTYFMATGQAGKANFLVLLRQIILLAPFLYLCPIFMPMLFGGMTGAEGLPFAYPITDLLSTAITMAFVLADTKNLDKAIETGRTIEEFREEKKAAKKAKRAAA